MENKVIATADGRVDAVQVTVGQTVGAGAVLVWLASVAGP